MVPVSSCGGTAVETGANLIELLKVNGHIDQRRIVVDEIRKMPGENGHRRWANPVQGLFQCSLPIDLPDEMLGQTDTTTDGVDDPADAQSPTAQPHRNLNYVHIYKSP
jgi:hypothetical protein